MYLTRWAAVAACTALAVATLAIGTSGSGAAPASSRLEQPRIAPTSVSSARAAIRRSQRDEGSALGAQPESTDVANPQVSQAPEGCLGALAAINPPMQGPAEEPSEDSIVITVQDETGKPVVDAIVTLRDITIGGRGCFFFGDDLDLVPAGQPGAFSTVEKRDGQSGMSLTFTATAPGYGVHSFEIKSWRNETVKLAPPATVFLTFTGPSDGKLWLKPFAETADGGRWIELLRDTAGQVALSNLAPGAYFVDYTQTYGTLDVEVLSEALTLESGANRAAFALPERRSLRVVLPTPVAKGAEARLIFNESRPGATVSVTCARVAAGADGVAVFEGVPAADGYATAEAPEEDYSSDSFDAESSSDIRLSVCYGGIERVFLILKPSAEGDSPAKLPESWPLRWNDSIRLPDEFNPTTVGAFAKHLRELCNRGRAELPVYRDFSWTTITFPPAECARLIELLDGGRLWLSTSDPYDPYSEG